jgi:hypothetical protein
MDTTRLMLQLRKETNRLGIPVEERKITSFSEVAEPVVFDCSGLGGKELNHDDKMIAVRGHLANLNAQAGTGHMEYMIYTKFEDEYVYMFPKCLQVDESDPTGRAIYGTLGGTFISGTDALAKQELEKLDETEFEKLLDRTSRFFWGKPFCKAMIPLYSRDRKILESAEETSDGDKIPSFT